MSNFKNFTKYWTALTKPTVEKDVCFKPKKNITILDNYIHYESKRADTTCEKTSIFDRQQRKYRGDKPRSF